MLILVTLLAVVVAELWTALVVAQWIGAFATVMALLALSALGVLLFRSEGPAVWRHVNADLAEGRVPTGALLDGLMVVLGAALLILPGFLTAIPGLLLLIPPTRWLLRPLLLRWVERRAERSATIGGVTFTSFAFEGIGTDGDRRGQRRWTRVVDVDGRDATSGIEGEAYAEVIDIEVDHPRELDRPD